MDQCITRVAVQRTGSKAEKINNVVATDGQYLTNSNISEDRTIQDESLNGTLWFDGPVVVE